MSKDEFGNAMSSHQLQEGVERVQGHLGDLAVALSEQLDGRLLSQYQVWNTEENKCCMIDK